MIECCQSLQPFWRKHSKQPWSKFASTLRRRNFKRRFHSENTKLEELKNATIAGYSGSEFEENCSENHVIDIIIVTTSFSKSFVVKAFSWTQKRKTDVFKFLRFEEQFWKPPFSWRISVDARPNRTSKAAFTYSSSVAWTLPNIQALKGTTNVISLD